MADEQKENNQNDDPEIARRFVRWHRVKTGIEKGEYRGKFKEGQIYWAAVGQNIGAEVYGKNERFSRPVLVYRKINSKSFMAIPLTSKFKEDDWHVSFFHHDRLETALLNQAKVMSTKRLGGCMGQIDEDDFRRVRDGFRRVY